MLRVLAAALRQEVDVSFRQADENHAILAGVREEDIGEAGCDDGEETEVSKGPGGVLARTAAAEVLARDEDLRASVLRLVEREVGVGRAGVGAFLEPPPIEEEELAIARSLDALEELLGDDLVGVDIGDIEWGGGAGEDVDGLRITP